MSAVMLGLLAWHVRAPESFSAHFHWILFAAGAVTMIKPNFVVYVSMLLGLIAIAETRELGRLAYLGGHALAGIAFFELATWALLSWLGIGHWRYLNLKAFFNQHTGKADNNVLVKNYPSGWRTFARYSRMFLDWHDIPFFRPWFFVLAAAALLLWRPAAPLELSEITYILFAFQFLFLAMSCLLFFYLKRAYPFFPITLLSVCLAISDLAAKSANPLAVHWTLALLGGLAIAVSFSRQFTRLAGLAQKMNFATAESPAKLEAALPDGAVVFAHCFAYRHFWQSERLRFKSCDDQSMDNERILKWALREGGDYALLCNRGGSFPEKGDQYGLSPLATFHSTGLESDYLESYRLYKICRPMSAS